ncbi:MAG TPA: CDP-alcohol phosphatidyltransferase family protein [Acidimicrobiia bacterium]|jgi:CDP-diacylglycerol--glycerol-3-phosphate 3-phosphatidyltransferase|nr:CDP-alcohol phosphatidyltransferase family protein [Acidimicrobiia bacterium]
MVATLYRAKPAFQRTLEPVVAALDRGGVSPDAVTWFGLAVAGGAGAVVAAASLWSWLMWVIPALLLVRMSANAVDGQLARRTATSEHGAVLNEVTDVAGDAAAYLPFAALAGSWAGWLVVGVVAIGMMAEVAAIAGDCPVRRNAGPLGKADRALGFSLLAIAHAASAPAVLVTGGLALMVALGLATVRNRLRQGGAD